jgi:hypothetical protein
MATQSGVAHLSASAVMASAGTRAAGQGVAALSARAQLYTLPRPLMSSTFMQPGTPVGGSSNLTWNQARMNAELNAPGTGMWQAGIKTVILQWAADYSSGVNKAYYPSPTVPQSTNLAGMLFTAAATASPAMKIWLGLGQDTYYDFYYNCANPSTNYIMGTLLPKQLACAAELYALYGSQIAGWYLPEEIDGNFAPGSVAQQTATSYYTALIAALKTAYPTIQVMASPFYAGLQLTPAQFATTCSLIWGSTALDILAPQTGSGDGSMSAYSMTPAQVASYFSAIRAAMPATTTLWANCDMYSGSGGPLPLASLTAAMAAAQPYVRSFTGFSFTSQMSPLGLGSSSTYNAYLAYMQATGDLVHVTEMSSAGLTARPVLTAPGGLVYRGAAALSAAPTLAISGTGVALAAAPRLSVARPIVVKLAQASLSAAPVLTARIFTVQLAAAPVLSATAVNTQKPVAHLAAAPVLSATPSAVTVHLQGMGHLTTAGTFASAILFGAAQLSVQGASYRPGIAHLSASPVLHAAGTDRSFPAAALAARPALTANATDTVRSSAALHASTALAAYVSSSSAALHAVPAVTAGSAVIRQAVAHLAAAAHLTVPASVTERAAATLAAATLLHAAGFRTTRASAALSAPGRLGASGTRGVRCSAALHAPGSIQAAGTRSAAGRAALTAQPSILVEPTVYSACHLSAAPVLHAAGTPGRTGQAALRAAPSLQVTAHGNDLAGAALRASPALVAVPLAQMVARSVLSAQAALQAAGEARFGRPLPLPPARLQPVWQRDPQGFAVAQERMRHAQALEQYGEMVMFALLWRPADIEAGLAQRCTRCYTPSSVIPRNPVLPGTGADAERRISAAYGQGNQNRCPLCYGTQIIAADASSRLAGLRALLVRPAIVTDTDQNQQRTAKGVVNTGQTGVQTTPDFRGHTLDYLFRADGRRYQLNVPSRTTLRTGFASPWQASAAVAYNVMGASLEDAKASVAYAIPPARQELEQVLGTYTRLPVSYAWIEQANGPLIVEEDAPPVASGGYQAPVTFPGGYAAAPVAPLPPPIDYIDDQSGGLLQDESGAPITSEA